MNLKLEPRPARSVVLGTAGHIDHGKTALVLALTGTDTDRLPEEKARGITIDLGFAALELTGPAGQRFEASLIDVPGHHAFLRNMLAGAGGIDAVMLVVAADEGVKAQTVEHLAVCGLLGVERGLVVLTKQDAVTPERLETARGEVAELVAGTFLDGTPVIAVSALHRVGIGELKAALGRLAAQIPERSEAQGMRLPVDRVFTVKGFGTVVTGTLQAGRVRAGESLVLEPGSRAVRVRGVQVHGRARAEVAAPHRVALNLAGVEVGDVHRGDTVIAGNSLHPTGVVDAELQLLPDTPPLRHRQRVRVHAFATESLATVLHWGREAAGIPSERKGHLVRLRLAKPMVLAPGDRFVVRQPSPELTLGGGRVLDAQPLPRLRKAAVLAWLETLRRASPEQEIELRVRRRASAGVSMGQLIAETGLTREALQRLARPGLAEGTLVLAGEEHLLAGEVLDEAQARLLRTLEQGREPLCTRTELRSRLGLTSEVFALALQRLQAARKVELRGDSVALPGAGLAQTAPTALDRRAAEVERVYQAAGLAPPLVAEAAGHLGLAAVEMRSIVTGLLRAGRLVRLGSDALLVHAEALDALKQRLQRHRAESFDVARFKSFTGLSRKHAIPLLEYLDGTRITRNAGGVRVVL